MTAPDDQPAPAGDDPKLCFMPMKDSPSDQAGLVARCGGPFGHAGRHESLVRPAPAGDDELAEWPVWAQILLEHSDPSVREGARYVLGALDERGRDRDAARAEVADTKADLTRSEAKLKRVAAYCEEISAEVERLRAELRQADEFGRGEFRVTQDAYDRVVKALDVRGRERDAARAEVRRQDERARQAIRAEAQAVRDLEAELDAARAEVELLRETLRASEVVRDLADRVDRIGALEQAGDTLMSVARSLAYAWETDTPDRVMWDEWKKVRPAIDGWMAARRAVPGEAS